MQWQKSSLLKLLEWVHLLQAVNRSTWSPRLVEFSLEEFRSYVCICCLPRSIGGLSVLWNPTTWRSRHFFRTGSLPTFTSFLLVYPPPRFQYPGVIAAPSAAMRRCQRPHPLGVVLQFDAVSISPLDSVQNMASSVWKPTTTMHLGAANVNNAFESFTRPQADFRNWFEIVTSTTVLAAPKTTKICQMSWYR